MPNTISGQSNSIVFGIDPHFLPGPVPPIGVMAAIKLSIMDLLPYIGKTTYVNGHPAIDSGTSSIMFSWKHTGPYINMATIANESITFFGALNTFSEGSRLGAAGYMVMDCVDIGIPISLPSKITKAAFKALSLYATTGASIPIFSNTTLGDSLVPDLLSFFKSALTGYFSGKILRRIGKKLYKYYRKLRYAVYKNGGFTKWLGWLKCKTFGDPVDVITGNVLYNYTDFELPGPIPLKWERTWHSDSSIQGALGHGTHFSYDLYLEQYPQDNCLAAVLPDGRAIGFPILEPGQTFFHRSEQLSLKRLEDGSYTLYNHSESLYYHYQVPSSNNKQRHYIQSISNSAGHQIQFQYNTQNHLHNIIDSAGRHLHISTDQKGRITQVHYTHHEKQKTKNEQPIEHTIDNLQQNRTLVQYTYNDAGDLCTITDALGKNVMIVYKNHLMVQKTDRNGQCFYWNYDDCKTGARCIHTWGEGGILEGKIIYHTDKGYNEVINSLGNTTLYHYNEDNLCTQIIDAEGNSTIYEYTEYEELYRIIDPEGNITGFHYDEQGQQIGISYPNGSSSQSHYNKEGRLHMVTNAQGQHQTWIYDEQGRLQTHINADNQISTYTYNQNHLISTIRNAQGETTSFEYDEQYNLIKLILPNQSSASWVYDSLGRCITAINPAGATQSFTYDAMGRLTGSHLPDGNAIRLQYNAYDEIIFAQDKHSKIKMEYTAMGSLKMQEQNGKRIHYNYNTEEQLTYILNERAERYSFKRDKRGYIIEETGFDGLTHHYQRSPNGHIVRKERTGGLWTEYEYNAMGNLVRLEHSDGSWESFNLNKKGQLIEAINQHCTVRFERDNLGRITKEIVSAMGKSLEQTTHTYTIENQYDELNNRIGVKTNLGAQLQYQPDNLGNITHIQASQAAQKTWEATLTYNTLGLETQRLLPGGIINTWQYDGNGRPIQHTIHHNNSITRKRKYNWGVNDRLNAMINELSKGQISYGHDDFNNLAWASYNGLHTLFKTYDEVGNVYETKDKTDRTYDKGGKLLKTPYATYAYDQQGNLIHKHQTDGQQWIYEWTAGGMLHKVIRPDNKEVEFNYDALGRRIQKIYEGKITRWLYDGNTPLHEWSYTTKDRPQCIVDDMGQLTWDKIEPTDNLITWVFENNSFRPAAKLHNNKQYSIICDYLGTPTEMYDELGNKTWAAELDVYGRITTSQGNVHDCPFRYQGQYQDIETGLYYNRFRYYSPQEGMYISKDPIGLSGGSRLYSYVHNTNTYIDTLGLTKECGGKYKKHKQIGANLRDDSHDYDHIRMETQRRKKRLRELDGAGVEIDEIYLGEIAARRGTLRRVSDEILVIHKVNAHKLKTNILGQNGNISQYDIYVSPKNDIFLMDKKGESVIWTGYNFMDIGPSVLIKD